MAIKTFRKQLYALLVLVLALGLIAQTAFVVSAADSLVINKIYEGDSKVSGTSIQTVGQVEVTFYDGSNAVIGTATTAVNADGSWSVNVPSGVTLTKGCKVSAEHKVRVAPDIDVQVKNLTDPSITYARNGHVLEYTATLENAGDNGSVLVPIVKFDLPADVDYTSGSLKIGSNSASIGTDKGKYTYDNSENSLTVYLSALGAGDYVSVSFQVKVANDLAVNELVLDATINGTNEDVGFYYTAETTVLEKSTGGDGGGSVTTPSPSPSVSPSPSPSSPGGDTGGGWDPENPYDNIVIIGELDTPLGSLELDSHTRYLNGYPDGTVGPERNITRAEAVVIFFRLLDDDAKTTATMSQVFPDVADGDWYSHQINYMASLGIVVGYPDGTFRPDAPITRAEFAAIISRFDNLILTTGTAFSDVSEDHWAIQYINSDYIKSWIEGYGDYSFKPEQNITRAETVKIVNTMLTRLPDSLPDDINPYTDIDVSDWSYIHMMEASLEHDYSRDEDKTEHWTQHYEPDGYLADVK